MNKKPESITMTFPRGGTAITEINLTDKHLGDAIRELKRIQLIRKKVRPRRKKTLREKIRKFFSCLHKAIQEQAAEIERAQAARKGAEICPALPEHCYEDITK